jgi:acetoin utilization deacetylase AcuC-like enzyme
MALCYMIPIKKKQIRIVFSHDYYYGLEGEFAYNYIDGMRFKKIRDMLVAQRIIKRKHILKPLMVRYEDMELVHTKQYLKQIQNPLNVANYLKIDYAYPWDSSILEFFRIVTGGTLLATEYALKFKTAIFNLGGGFHHAQTDKAAGFCLINDVAIAIQKYRQKKMISRSMIIDLDYHQGDGNLIIFRDDPSVYTFALNASHWVEVNKKNNLEIYLPEHCEGSTYLNILKDNLPKFLSNLEPDIIYYIAGSDPYIDDLVGDLHLSRKEMLQRNLFVLNTVKKRKIPLVIVAGGGYGTNSWQVYYDFIRASIDKSYSESI